MTGQLFGPYGLVGCYLCGKPVTLDPRDYQRPELVGLVPPGPALCCDCLVEHKGWSHADVAYGLRRRAA